MKRIARLTVVCFGVAVLLTACERPPRRWTDSGIRKALNTDALMRTAGTPQGIELVSSDNHESQRGGDESRKSDSIGYWVESKRRFYITIASGTRGQLLAAYRDEVKREIERCQGRIHSTASAIQAGGGGGEVHDFGFGYSCGGNEGIVRVFSFPGRTSTNTAGAVEVVLFCYEYSR